MTSSCMRLPPMTQSTAKSASVPSGPRVRIVARGRRACVIHASDELPAKCAPAKVADDGARVGRDERARVPRRLPAGALLGVAFEARARADEAVARAARAHRRCARCRSTALARSAARRDFASLAAVVRDVHAAASSSTTMHARRRISVDDASSRASRSVERQCSVDCVLSSPVASRPSDECACPNSPRSQSRATGSDHPTRSCATRSRLRSPTGTKSRAFSSSRTTDIAVNERERVHPCLHPLVISRRRAQTRNATLSNFFVGFANSFAHSPESA